MIKYPPYKKNAQPYKRALYPGLATVSLDRLNNLMPYYYILARKGRKSFRCYVRLTHKAADLIHDELYSKYDLVQVCDVEPDQVDRSLLLHK